ncbi:hypothetical protein KFU94_56575 [Chloroflexi bacterium TSY]|nr:hypothetical protein [Chloroflexi bacterium TSY]
MYQINKTPFSTDDENQDEGGDRWTNSQHFRRNPHIPGEPTEAKREYKKDADLVFRHEGLHGEILLRRTSRTRGALLAALDVRPTACDVKLSIE